MKPPAIRRPLTDSIKETLSMPKRYRSLAVLVGAAVMLLGALPVASAAATSPWWQVLTGSRPTNLWIPGNEVQEIVAPSTPFILSVEGTTVGIFNGGPFPPGTAENVQTALETAYGAGNVEVTGGPGGTAPFIVTSIGDDAGEVVAPVESPFGATTRVVKTAGSGRLVITLTNLGDAPVDGSSVPVKIRDELPAGVEALAVEALAGAKGESGPVECTVETPSLVSCSFAGTLPSYEAIEIEVIASVTGEPPVAGAPGSVEVSGGGAPSVTVPQPVIVSPEPTPFGIEQFSAKSEEEGGAEVTQAGSHPFQLTTTVQLNSGAFISRGDGVEQPALPRNLRFPLPVGLVGNATAVPQCKLDVFYDITESLVNACPDEAAIGVASVTVSGLLPFLRVAVPVFNLPPARGEPARFGFTVAGDPILIDTAVDPDRGYRIVASVSNTSQLAQFLSGTVSFWGAPGDPRHDSSRGWNCVYRLAKSGPCERPPNLPENAFLREPVSCNAPLVFAAELEPWNVPFGSVVDSRSIANDALSGCNRIPFNPMLSASPTTGSASGPSGLDFRLDMPNAGLLNPKAIAEGQAKKVEVTLPEGMTVNPSGADGLGACTPADYRAETVGSAPGAGCPESSKVGSVDISTPLLEEEAHGSVFVAAPYDNPFDSLLALYVVAKIPERGILVKQAGKIELNPDTGQLTTTFDNLPQIPFSTFNLHFKEGSRAPLVLPATCGTYGITAKFTPWHAADPDNPQPNEIVTRASSFSVEHGVDGGPCPSGTLPFKPDLVAGTESNAAGRYSPFTARLTRDDGEQEFTRFSLKLPPGVIGKLGGIPFCANAAIAAAEARTGPHGAQEEAASPSCPEAAQLGRTLVGAGVGSSLAYVPGKLYLAGPYQGAKLSIVAITTAKVGPFDLGTVVIRQALRIDPETARVTADGSGAKPIPHILQGIVVHARDIRVYVDRPDFVLNPTSCERMATASTVLGSGVDFGSSADDQAATPSSPFQAADCARLGFKPKLTLSLRGGNKRADTPRLKAVVKARKGDANIGAAQVILPHSVFLEQAHIRTICTRVQFAAGGGNGEKCPKASIYGRAKALTPLLDEPLAGPVYLRSSNHQLPDLVAALHSDKVDINLAGRIDSKGGRIRNTFEAVPDAPVRKFVLEMQGGRKGLVTNSVNLCNGKNRAIATFTGQNGKVQTLKPLVRASCPDKEASKRNHVG
jgi:hypothetical protein